MLAQDLTFEEKKDWIRLSRTENVGPVTFKTLLSVYGTPKEALKNLPDFAKRGGRKKPLVIPDESLIYEEMEKVASFLRIGLSDTFKADSGLSDGPDRFGR